MEWHPTKNDPLLPEYFTPSSEKEVWWQDYLGHEWQEKIRNRTSKWKRLLFMNIKNGFILPI